MICGVESVLSKFLLRRNARMCLVQLVTQREIRGSCDLEEFCRDEVAWGWREFDCAFLHKLYSLIDAEWERSLAIVNGMISARWEWRRMCPVLRAVVRCALTELGVGAVDIRIVVKEYLRIARSFYEYDAKEVVFVRGIINAYGRKLGLTAKGCEYAKDNHKTQDLTKQETCSYT